MILKARCQITYNFVIFVSNWSKISFLHFMIDILHNDECDKCNTETLYFYISKTDSMKNIKEARFVTNQNLLNLSCKNVQ